MPTIGHAFKKQTTNQVELWNYLNIGLTFP
jgi:hypothetical protein